MTLVRFGLPNLTRQSILEHRRPSYARSHQSQLLIGLPVRRRMAQKLEFLVGIQRRTQVELNTMVPRGGLEPPTHGFSIQSNDPIKAFLYDRISRGLSVQTIKFYQNYLERLQTGLLSPLLVTT